MPGSPPSKLFVFKGKVVTIGAFGRCAPIRLGEAVYTWNGGPPRVMRSAPHDFGRRLDDFSGETDDEKLRSAIAAAVRP